MLYDCGPNWLNTAWLLLRRAGQLGYDKQLFLVNPGGGDITGLSLIYSSVLQAWQIFSYKWTAGEIGDHWVFKEPLFLTASSALKCPCLPALEPVFMRLAAIRWATCQGLIAAPSGNKNKGY